MPQKTFDFKDRNTGKMYSMPWEGDDPPPDELMEQYMKVADGPPVASGGGELGGVNPLNIAGTIGDAAPEFGRQFLRSGRDMALGMGKTFAQAIGGDFANKYRGSIEGVAQIDRNLAKAKEVGGLEGAARYAATPFDVLGLPVTSAADKIIDRNYGGALFDTLASVGGVYGTQQGLTAAGQYVRQGIRRGGQWGRERMGIPEPVETSSYSVAQGQLPAAPEPRIVGRGRTTRTTDSRFVDIDQGPTIDMAPISVQDTTPVPFTAPPVTPLRMGRQLTASRFGTEFLDPQARPPYEFVEPDTIIPPTVGTRFYQGDSGIADATTPYSSDLGPTNIRKSQMELEPVLDDKGDVTGINAIGGHEITPQIEGFIPGREGYTPASGQNATVLPSEFGELAPVPPMMAAQGGTALGRPETIIPQQLPSVGPIDNQGNIGPIDYSGVGLPVANRGERLSQTELINAELIKRQIAERRASRIPPVAPIAPPIAPPQNVIPPVAPLGSEKVAQPVKVEGKKRDSWTEKDPNTELVTKEEIKQQFGVPTKVAVEKGWAVLTKKGFAITKQGNVVLGNIRKMAEEQSNKPQMSRVFSPLIGADNRISFADGIKKATDEQLQDYHTQLTEDMKRSEDRLTGDPGDLNRHVVGVQKRRPGFDKKKLEQIEAEQDRRRKENNESLDPAAGSDEPQFGRSFKDGRRGIQVTQNIKKSAKELTTGYSRPLEEIMVRESLQNALDVVKILGDKGKINVHIDSDGLTVSDNGKGMTIDELEGVFTTLFESGKTDDPNATGGKGIGSATYMFGGDYFKAVTVAVNEHGQKVRLTIEGTADDLVEHADTIEEIVPDSTPTGTTIKTKFAAGQSDYSAKSMLENIVKYSRGVKSEIKFKWLTYDMSPSFQSGKGDKVIGHENIDGNEVEIIFPETGKITTEVDKQDYIQVYYLNNGMYQFRDFVHLPEKMPEMPDELIVTVSPSAKEHTKEYPFPTQRESLKSNVQERIDELIKQVIVNPQKAKRQNRTQELYDSMPVVAAKNTIRKTVLFDPGERLTTAELNYVQNSRVMTEMIALFDKVIDDIIVNVGDAKLANRLEGIGIVFGPGMHGIHIPNPSTGKSTILINPFISLNWQNSTPYNTAHYIIGTNLHEAAHIGTETKGDMIISSADRADSRIGKHLQAYLNEIIEAGGDQGHTTPFLKRLGDIYAKYGPEQTFDAVDRLHATITDNTGGYNSEVQELLRIYTESRGRAETKEDLLSRTGEKSSDQGDGGKKNLPGDDSGSGGGVAGPVEKKPIKFGPTTDDFERARAEGIYPQGLTSEQKGKFLSTRVRPFIGKQQALPPVPNYVSPIKKGNVLKKSQDHEKAWKVAREEARILGLDFTKANSLEDLQWQIVKATAQQTQKTGVNPLNVPGALDKGGPAYGVKSFLEGGGKVEKLAPGSAKGAEDSWPQKVSSPESYSNQIAPENTRGVDPMRWDLGRDNWGERRSKVTNSLADASKNQIERARALGIENPESMGEERLSQAIYEKNQELKKQVTDIKTWKENATPEQKKQVKTEVDNLIKEIDEALKEIPDLPEDDPSEPQYSRVRQDPRKRSVSLKIGDNEPTRRIKVEYSKKKQALLEIGNFSRSMVSSMDFSAAFRQASPMIASTQFWTNMGPMAAAFFSEDYYNKMAKAIENHPDFPYAMSAKVPFTDMDHLSTREERYKSEWAERVTSLDFFTDAMKERHPWMKKLRRHSYVRMSGRAYTGYLNAVRMATFTKLLDHAKKQGNDLRANVSLAESDQNMTNKDLQKALAPMKELANVVGDVTGRSNFGKALEPTAEILNIIIFSPRLAWSRMKLLNPYTYVNPNISWTARQQYLKSLASLATVGLLMYAASKATGGDPELDLESVDFGKTRFGENSRAEMVPGGFAPYVRMMYMLPRIVAHTATKGEWPDVGKVSPITGRRTRLNSGDFGAPTGLSETYSFIEKKEAPNASLVTDFLRGTDFMGRELDITSMDPAYNPILGRVLPIMGSDTREMITQEKPKYWPAMVPASLGWGVQTYGDEPFRRPNKGRLGRVDPIR